MFRTIRDDFARHPGDPSARTVMVAYRFGRWALARRSRLSRKIFTKLYGFFNFFVINMLKLDIPAEVEIGEGFHLIHGYGFITIHPDVTIGKNCGMMHNVTIGQNMFSDVPTIGDDVFIGVGAAILGPVKIGDRARIGANAVVTRNVPADTIVQSPQSRMMPSLTAMAVKVSDKAAKANRRD